MNINGNQTINNGDYAMQFPTIQQNTDLQQAVDAKDLHQALGLHPAKWSEWSKNNIANNPFALEGIDYGVYNPELNTQGGRPTTNYYLSIDFAKKLAMQVRTKKGEEIRDYFLDCERKVVSASNPVAPALPNFTDPYEAAIAWAEQYKAKEIAQEQLALAAPKVSHYDNVVNRRGLLTATQVGQKIGLSAVKLNKILDELKVYNQAVKRSRVFNSWFIQQGLGELKQTPEGHSQALFSLKGEAWVIERLTSEGAF